jgi:hypothetical protein
MTNETNTVVDTSSTQVHVYLRRASSWSAAKEELSYFGETWLFRGQRDASWGLRCSLDRKRGTTDPVHAELSLKDAFSQRAHLFLQNAREPETMLEWFSLIQHHGGPTRLIDFTRSSFVAAFFALEEGAEADVCAVWAVDELACHRRAVKRLRSVDPDFSWLQDHHSIEGAVDARIGARPPHRFVAPVQPSRLNARMAIQQGMFVCLGDPGSDLFANLNPEVEDEQPLQVVKVEFPRSERGRALWALRQMGVSRETLFPGLDGLARSLEHLLVPRDLSREALLTLLDRPHGWPGPVK